MTTCVICSQIFESRTTYGLCPSCWSRDRLREWDRLQSALRRAERDHLPATLTLPQWLSTAADFSGLCAYCQEISYSYISMVHPLAGVTYENVVPACRACYAHLRGSFEDAKQRVTTYVAQKPEVTVPTISQMEEGVYEPTIA